MANEFRGPEVSIIKQFYSDHIKYNLIGCIECLYILETSTLT